MGIRVNKNELYMLFRVSDGGLTVGFANKISAALIEIKIEKVFRTSAFDKKALFYMLK